MSFYVWCEIVCQKCARTTSGRYTGGHIPRAAMAAEAKEHGWSHNRDTGDWTCRICIRGEDA